MEQQPRLPLWFLVANWALVVGAFVIGWTVGGRRIADLPEPQATAFELVYDEILRSHVDPQDGHELLDRAITAMVDGLDPYSQYVPPREVSAYDERNTGHYEGVGLLMVQHGEDIVVYYPFPGGPADRAGVRPGDRIAAVDDQDLAAVAVDQRHEAASRLVRGAAGTSVRLRLRRDDGEVTLSLQRSGVQRSSVKWVHVADPGQGLGYLYVSDFHVGVARQVDEAIASLQRQGPLRGLVVDLRFDGGGNLDECVAMARAFVPDGTIVSQRRRDNEIVETFAASPQACRFPDLPLVVLVNERSASASEVLAGALQDHGRAAIVGAPTFGKGYVNTVYRWKDFRLKLTTAHFYTPSGRNIDRHHRRAADPHASPPASQPDPGGITPDAVVAVAEAEQKAIEGVLASHEPPAEHLAAFTAVAAKYGARVPGPPRAATDPQLARALAVLQERIAAGSPANETPKAR